jgi:ribonuclease Z
MKTIKLLTTFAVFILSSCVWGAGGTVPDPRGIAPDRYTYYPGTESLATDEIRIVARGTGMPASRHGQAAA